MKTGDKGNWALVLSGVILLGSFAGGRLYSTVRGYGSSVSGVVALAGALVSGATACGVLMPYAALRKTRVPIHGLVLAAALFVPLGIVNFIILIGTALLPPTFLPTYLQNPNNLRLILPVIVIVTGLLRRSESEETANEADFQRPPAH